MSRRRELLCRLQEGTKARLDDSPLGLPEIEAAQQQLLLERQRAELARLAENARQARRLSGRFTHLFEAAALLLALLAGAQAFWPTVETGELLVLFVWVVGLLAVLNTRLIAGLRRED